MTAAGVCLALEMRKSAGKTDEFGNYIFEVEASNENLDLENQIVLQRALMESRDEFLRNGVISYDHLHKRKAEDGSIISDPAMVIGEPIDVRTEGRSTIVTGKLYATNEKAQEIIRLLKAGSTRIKASVGGIFPKIVKDVRTGVERIVHVLWNDLALTVSPVNGTVGSAEFAKALNPSEFIAALPEEMKKALCAGHETDSEEMEGGRVLIGEDVQAVVIDAAPTYSLQWGLSDIEREAVHGLIKRLRLQKIHGTGQAQAFLVSCGIEKTRAAEIVHEILEQGEKMKKGLLSKHISALLKSLPDEVAKEEDEVEDEVNTEKSDIEDEEVVEKADGEEPTDEEAPEELTDADFEDDEEEEEEEEEEAEESIEGDDLVKAISEELHTVRKAQKALRSELRTMHQVQNNLARVLVETAKAVQKLGNEPMPHKSVLNKSFAKGAQKKIKPAQSDLDTVNDILIKAVKEGRIDIFKSSLISSDFQKAMATGKPMRKEFYDFLQAEYAAGRN